VEGSGQENLRELIEGSGDKYTDVTLLKVAHHGSEYTTDKEFLDYVSPRLALISCGRDNSYGHPHKALVERLEEAGADIYRTDEMGSISVTPKGNKFSVSTFIKIDKGNLLNR
jgi:competence protein ComEC